MALSTPSFALRAARDITEYAGYLVLRGTPVLAYEVVYNEISECWLAVQFADTWRLMTSGCSVVDLNAPPVYVQPLKFSDIEPG